MIPPTIAVALIPHAPHRTHKLGRHVQHDERSKAYKALLAPQPKTVRHVRNVPIYDQGQIGSCTGNAASGCVSTAPFAHHGNEAEALSVYEDATKIDAVPGTYPPDDTGSSGLAVCDVLKKRGLITGYGHTFDLDSLLRALTLGPGIVGMTWLAGCDRPGVGGLIRYEGSVEGGHEIVLAGLDVDEKVVIFDNSWGAGWGDKGSFRMSFADLEKALKDRADAIFPILPVSR